MNDSRHQTPRRILVVANETAEGAALHEAIRAHAHGNEAELLVVAPALNSRPRRWTSAKDEAFAAAARRLRRCLDLLDWAGIEANGVVGDADPLKAITDALRWFPADELVIAPHPEARSHWLSRKVVDRARSRFGVPVVPVVVERSSGADSR